MDEERQLDALNCDESKQMQKRNVLDNLNCDENKKRKKSKKKRHIGNKSIGRTEVQQLSMDPMMMMCCC